MKALTCLAFASCLAVTISATTLRQDDAAQEKSMILGNFSVSLAVADLKASRAFYEKLDFVEVAGDMEQNWIILQNGSTTVGLFHGMFQDNIMTFNPGWDKDKNTLKDFEDVRSIQAKLKARGIEPIMAADEKSDGPASFVIMDPDGNTLLFDQHVDHPAKKKAVEEK